MRRLNKLFFFFGKVARYLFDILRFLFACLKVFLFFGLIGLAFAGIFFQGAVYGEKHHFDGCDFEKITLEVPEGKVVHMKAVCKDLNDVAI